MNFIKAIVTLCLFAALVSCGFFTLVPEAAAPRSNAADPWLDPYSVALTTETVAGADQFGYTVAFDGDYFVVGAPEDGSGDGRAFVYRRTDEHGWGTPAELLPAVAVTDAEFGASVAISGNTIFVGAPAEEVNLHPGAGAVHVFVRTGPNTWVEDDVIIMDDISDPDSYTVDEDRFGQAVACDGTWLAVSAYHDDYDERATDLSANYGAVYLFKYIVDGWEDQDRIDGRPFGTAEEFFDKGDRFGRSLAFGDDFIIVGAPFEDVGADTRAGVAYIFTTDGSSWSPAVRIVNPEPEPSGSFAWHVFGTSGAVTIGSVGHTEDGKSSAGALYYYARNSGGTWGSSADQRIVAAAPEDTGFFGLSSAIVGSTLLIGAPYYNTNGEVVVYELDAGVWSLDSVIRPFDPAIGFGVSMAVDADFAMFGATEVRTLPGGPGSAYLYTSN